ncbi:MAG: CRISPR-associated helicase Cas3' [Bernardetiaceae bacterium]|nr:CRISPR-associated helicase Cas3' [Bernardetiaceae bacterium]
MSNSYKSVASIIKDTDSISSFLKNAESYYAHIAPAQLKEKLKPETLAEHIELVQKKCVLLCEIHRLDPVIDKMILHFVSYNFSDENQNKAGNFIKKLFVNVIVFHDYGKVNENFQAHPDKMNNPNFRGKILKNSPIKTHHSSLGAYLFITKHLQELASNSTFERTEILFLSYLTLIFSYPIFKHHGKHLNDKIKDKISFSEDEVNCMKNYLDCYQFQIHEQFSTIIPENTNFVFKHMADAELKATDILYKLTRLSFSLLTASDYLASGEYMSNGSLELKNPIDFGVLSRERINKLYLDAYTLKSYNQSTHQVLETYKEFKNPKTTSGENLNILRQEMAIEAIRNVRKNIDKRLFYIEAPTGGGKTNLSMLATVELLKANPELNKVFYVFPFTTLITQTYQSMIETLGLEENEIIQLHSKAGFKTNREIKEEDIEDQDAYYGSQKRNYVDNLFVNYPFCLLSHIKFFDILKTNEKNDNYLMHRLANSVVVLDELQSYNPSHWDKIIFFIRNYAEYFNMHFILMSATLPKLDRIKSLQNITSDFVYLLPNARENYFQNPNFAQRINFRFDLLQEKDLELEDLAQVLLEKSQKYAQKDFGKAKPKGSVYTIIEFIFKKSATEFYNVMKTEQVFFDEIFVLSGTILEHRRKYIIEFLKNPENRKKKILLITTQVVEAGVDIDMDLGFKNQSLVDSDEQLAGRINRNVNKKDCELYLFKKDEPRVLYAKDKRYKITREQLSKQDYQEILQTKNFDKLYDLVLKNIEDWNRTEMAIGFEDYLSELQRLNFKSVHDKFRLIEQKNLSVFVPLAIHSNSFSTNEKEFLKIAKIHPNDTDKFEGSEIFDLYIDLIENKKADFIAQKVSMKTLQGIISKYVFSIFDDAKGNTRQKLIQKADIEKITARIGQESKITSYGYIYLEYYADVYDEIGGLDDSKFETFENYIL